MGLALTEGLGAVEMLCSCISTLLGSRSTRVGSSTVAERGESKPLSARAGHGGPAGTSPNAVFFVASERLSLHLQPGAALHAREATKLLSSQALAPLQYAQEHDPRSSSHLRTASRHRCPQPAVAVGSPASCRKFSWPMASNTFITSPTAPNHSVKASPNGGPPGPGHRYAVHFLCPGPGVPPSVPPYLER